jgi:hypothetical protein
MGVRMSWFATLGSSRTGMGMRVVVLLSGIVMGFGAVRCGAASPPVKAATEGDVCRRVILAGEVKVGEEWHAAIGEGWMFRVVPIGAVKGQTYTGWDLVVDRVEGGGYPDALLLATPPYGSLSEREIGTTFGLRAQDAIGWNPRRFHFLTSEGDLTRGRALFGAMMGAKGAAQGEASAELLGMLKDAASGEFRVLDATLTAGAANPTEFARQWSQRLRETPHTVEQKVGAASARGELTWIRFSTTLWFKRGWRLPAGLKADEAKCAQ